MGIEKKRLLQLLLNYCYITPLFTNPSSASLSLSLEPTAPLYPNYKCVRATWVSFSPAVRNAEVMTCLHMSCSSSSAFARGAWAPLLLRSGHLGSVALLQPVHWPPRSHFALGLPSPSPEKGPRPGLCGKLRKRRSSRSCPGMLARLRQDSG